MSANFFLGFTNSGVYRYSHASGNVSAVVVPFVTRSPDGSTFSGTGFNTSLNNRGDLVFGGILANRLGVFEADKKGVITTVVAQAIPCRNIRHSNQNKIQVPGSMTVAMWLLRRS
uniref:Uncharacterized protein n=1 Tax=Solibacter usitatus (strain Ellin6076) TaxID=234267 RepID=Q028D5_SOLUE